MQMGENGLLDGEIWVGETLNSKWVVTVEQLYSVMLRVVTIKGDFSKNMGEIQYGGFCQEIGVIEHGWFC